MNCIEPFSVVSNENKHSLAFVTPFGKEYTFYELRDKAKRMQSSFASMGLKTGDNVLVAIDISIDLYACTIALMGLGATVILVEPWMPIKNISEALKIVKPKFFVSSIIGKFWGMRVSEIIKIPKWVSLKSLLSSSPQELIVEDLPDYSRGIITFTSGTSGFPKGVVREHGYLLTQFSILNKSLCLDNFKGADLSIFANWTLLNLAQGKTTVFCPSHWSEKNLKWIIESSKKFKLETMTTGPAFAMALFKQGKIDSLKDIHIGGALTPISFFENLIIQHPNACIKQIYGSSEVEPVCIVKAQESIAYSKEKNYYHSLFLGKPISDIIFNNEDSGMWVSGPHVSPLYLNNQKDNDLNKRIDQQNRIWHFMGDQITINENQDWIYSGRSYFEKSDFFLEQEVYKKIDHDKAFVFRNIKNELELVCDDQNISSHDLNITFPQITKIYQSKIFKDIRHRSRIDRKKTLYKLNIGIKE